MKKIAKSAKLEACPFCGGEAEVIHTRVIADDAIRIGCTRCRTVTQAVAKAAAIWNKRTDIANERKSNNAKEN